MQFVVIGAGAIGGVVGARLFERGHDVTFVARGPHLRAIQDRGLELRSPEGTTLLPILAVSQVRDANWSDGAVALLTVKSQDTEAVLDELAAVAPSWTPVVCMQNGVANESRAAERFTRVYAVSVMCPTTHVEPGVVEANSSPITGILDVGSYPEGADPLAAEIATTLRAATFESVARDDIMRWKWAKLLLNLTNALEAACGSSARGGPLAELVRSEAEACLDAAGISYASAEEDRTRRADLLRVQPVGGRARPGGSTFQSLLRGAGSVETEYLNGEIVSLGRRCGVATPANEYVTQLVTEMARNGTPPGSLDPADLLARVQAFAVGRVSDGGL